MWHSIPGGQSEWPEHPFFWNIKDRLALGREKKISWLYPFKVSKTVHSLLKPLIDNSPSAWRQRIRCDNSEWTTHLELDKHTFILTTVNGQLTFSLATTHSLWQQWMDNSPWAWRPRIHFADKTPLRHRSSAFMVIGGRSNPQTWLDYLNFNKDDKWITLAKLTYLWNWIKN